MWDSGVLGRGASRSPTLAPHRAADGRHGFGGGLGLFRKHEGGFWAGAPVPHFHAAVRVGRIGGRSATQTPGSSQAWPQLPGELEAGAGTPSPLPEPGLDWSVSVKLWPKQALGRCRSGLTSVPIPSLSGLRTVLWPWASCERPQALCPQKAGLPPGLWLPTHKAPSWILGGELQSSPAASPGSRYHR